MSLLPVISPLPVMSLLSVISLQPVNYLSYFQSASVHSSHSLQQVFHHQLFSLLTLAVQLLVPLELLSATQPMEGGGQLYILQHGATLR